MLEGKLVLSNNKSAILTTNLKETWLDDNNANLEGQTFPSKIEMKRITTTVPISASF